jgi:sec-independent protein translocase protein TatB
MGFSETVFLFILALLIFGPKRLPEIARQVGKIVNDLKRASNEFQAQIKSEISQLEMDEHRKVLESSEAPVGSVPASALHPELVDAPDPVKPEPAPETHPLLKAAPDA